jgi:hypothetical protein
MRLETLMRTSFIGSHKTIDGYFEVVPTVWHKEILWAMAQGITASAARLRQGGGSRPYVGELWPKVLITDYSAYQRGEKRPWRQCPIIPDAFYFSALYSWPREQPA